MKTRNFKQYVAILLTALSLSACKIDMTVNGDGNVKTDTGTFDCSTGTSGDCTQSYVTDVTQCPNYVAPSAGVLPTIPPNCTVLVASNTNCNSIDVDVDGDGDLEPAIFANGVQWQNCIPDDNGFGETFHAQANQGSHFGSWTGDNVGCNGQTSLTCNRWIDQGSAGTDAQINITANFEQEVDPKNAAYTYDYQGHRASKTVAGVTTYFNYSDIDGQLLGEYQYMTVDGTRKLMPVREYIYLDGIQAAMNVWNNTDPVHPQKQIVYFATNQTGQPMVAWDSSGNPVYERQQTPFMESMGEYSAPNIEVNTGSKGMYNERESGYWQNWNRTQIEGLGFTQPDPSGQNGGINTYLAVNANPVMYTDSDGLAPGQHYDSYGAANKDALFDVFSLGASDGLEWVYRIYEGKEDGGCSYWSYALSSSGSPRAASPPSAPPGTKPQGTGHDHPVDHSHLSEKGDSADPRSSGDKGWADRTAYHDNRPEPVYMIDMSGHVQGYNPSPSGDAGHGQTKDWPSPASMPNDFPF